MFLNRLHQLGESLGEYRGEIFNFSVFDLNLSPLVEGWVTYHGPDLVIGEPLTSEAFVVSDVSAFCERVHAGLWVLAAHAQVNQFELTSEDSACPLGGSSMAHVFHTLTLPSP